MKLSGVLLAQAVYSKLGLKIFSINFRTKIKSYFKPTVRLTSISTTTMNSTKWLNWKNGMLLLKNGSKTMETIFGKNFEQNGVDLMGDSKKKSRSWRDHLLENVLPKNRFLNG